LSAKSNLRAHFLAHVGVVLNSDELSKIGNISEWARRVRELREEGWDIATDKDEASLKPGQYILRSSAPAKPRPSFDRAISKKTRAFVLDRNGFTCQMCGAEAGSEVPGRPGTRVRLHMGHVIDRHHGGTDEANNLRALCSRCNEGLSDLALPRPAWTQLLTQVRRATREDQLRVLDWLKRKYPDHD
jgi:hypothetical protein